MKKLAIYAREGVQRAWIADLLAQTLAVLRLEHGRWAILDTRATDAKVRAQPFEAVELDLTLL